MKNNKNEEMVEPNIEYCYNCANSYLPDEAPKGTREGLCSFQCVGEHYE